MVNENNSFITICTFDHNSIQYYLAEEGKDVKVIMMSEINNPFCPLPYQKLFLNVVTQREEIDKVVEKIQNYISSYGLNKTQNTKMPGAVSGAAIVSGIDSLIEVGGRVIVFTCNSCVNGFGASKNIDDGTQFGTEKEKLLYLPQNDKFVKYSETIIDKRVGVDLFVFGAKQFDLSSFTPICTNTGGAINYYNIDYNSETDMKSKYDRLFYDLSRILSRENYYDVKFMFRSNSNIEVSEILGPFGKRFGSGFSIPSCDPDTAFTFVLKLNTYLKNEAKQSFQIVALFINNYNQRFLRVFNLTLNCSTDLSKNFKIK